MGKNNHSTCPCELTVQPVCRFTDLVCRAQRLVPWRAAQWLALEKLQELFPRALPVGGLLMDILDSLSTWIPESGTHQNPDKVTPLVPRDTNPLLCFYFPEERVGASSTHYIPVLSFQRVLWFSRACSVRALPPSLPHSHSALPGPASHPGSLT